MMKNLFIPTDIAIPLPPVGQLAKTHCPTLKPNTRKGLNDGRQLKSNHHTPTHAGGYFDLNGSKYQQHKPFKLYKKAENDFLKTIPLLFENLEKTNVVFHNKNFVSAIFDTYSKQHGVLFLDWVKTFALIRKSYRTTLTEGVIETTDEDFLTALQVFKLQNTKPKQKSKRQKEKIWQVINQHFPHELFTNRDIHHHTLIALDTINTHLRQMRTEGKLKRCKKPLNSSYNHYQLIQK